MREMKVCDNCLTAAYDEAVGMGFIHEANNREFLEVMCIELGADIADHVCLVSEGFEKECDCLCRSVR